MRVSLFFPVSVLGLLVATPAAAQRAGSADIFIEDCCYEEAEPPAPPLVLTEEQKAKLAAELKAREEQQRIEAEKRRIEWEAYRVRRIEEAKDDIYPFQDPKLRALSSPVLETFRNDRDLIGYLKRLVQVEDDTDRDWLTYAAPPAMPGENQIVVAMLKAQDEEVVEICTDPEMCAEPALESIVATGTRISTPNITNVQSAGVDEGDIVKQIGDYLITLQDGRLFAVHIPTMRLTDRTNIYRYDGTSSYFGASWYDEILVQDDRIIVTAYDYDEDATELSVFSLDQKTGKISPDGVFLISSDDYYSGSNYASRIIGDTLVLYAPYAIDPDEVDIVEDGWNKPFVRRWLPPEERSEEQQRGKPLFDARDIYRPVLPTASPTIHTISTCPLGGYREGRDLACETIGFVGPEEAEMYVTADSIYLWNSLHYEVGGGYWREAKCGAAELSGTPAFDDIVEGALYRITLRSGEVGVVGVRGGLYDQYSMDEYKGRLRALSPRQAMSCADNYDDEEGWTEHVALLDIPLRQFDMVFRAAREADYATVPPPMTGTVQNRFAGDWLLYGSDTSTSYYGLDEPESWPTLAANYAVAVPIRTPALATRLPLGHGVERLELVGDGAIANGYRDNTGLAMSFIKLDGAPRISDSMVLAARYETESRSHAFNSTTDAAGNSIMGVPTSLDEGDSGRRWWWSGASDLSFLRADPSGKLSDAGVLANRPEEETETAEGYRCEVSCIDWYGNARPIFIDGRIYGLMGTELVAAELVDGKVVPRQRVDLTGPVTP
jgi:hypothetical protein